MDLNRRKYKIPLAKKMFPSTFYVGGLELSLLTKEGWGGLSTQIVAAPAVLSSPVLLHCPAVPERPSYWCESHRKQVWNKTHSPPFPKGTEPNSIDQINDKEGRKPNQTHEQKEGRTHQRQGDLSWERQNQRPPNMHLNAPQTPMEGVALARLSGCRSWFWRLHPLF